jgi:CRP-like cAMP-binding protein
MNTAQLPTQLMEAAVPRTVQAGDMVFRQGGVAHSVFLVRAGGVRLVRHGRAGEQVVLHEARTGDFFAEASLDSSRYHCDAVAVAPGELLCIPSDTVRRLLETDAPFARQWASLLARQLRATRARLERLSLRSASERIEHLLVSEGRGPRFEVALDGTLKDLARRVGLTHESLYRTLARMEAEGVVERGDGCIRFRRPTGRV